MKFLLNWLWQHLIFSGVLMFAAGSSAIADTIASAGEAGGEDGGAADGVDGSDGAAGGDESGDAGSGSGSGDESAGDDQREDAGAAGDKEAAAAGDGRKMPAALRAHVAELKKTNPALAKEINGLFWKTQAQQKEIQQHFPGGIKEAIELKQQIEDLGGPEALTELNDEVQDYRGVDQALISGDPAFIGKLPAQVKEGFFRMMPHVLGEYAQADPEGYDRYFAGVMFNTLRDNEFTTDLRMISEHLSQYDQEKNPGIKQALALLDKNYKFVNGLKQLAGSQPTKANGQGKDNHQATELEQREARLKQSERSATLRSIGQEVSGFINPKIDTVVKELSKGKVLPEGGLSQVRSDAMRAAMIMLAGDRKDKHQNHLPSDFERKYDAYLDAGDRAGAAKLLKSRLEPLLAEQTRKAYKRLYGEATLGSGKVAAAAGKRDQADKGKDAGASADASFALVGYNPKPASIDYKKTSRAMIFNNQAVLKNGKKVTWRNDAPAEK